jgi:hypothetical protein
MREIAYGVLRENGIDIGDRPSDFSLHFLISKIDVGCSPQSRNCVLSLMAARYIGPSGPMRGIGPFV